MFDDAHNLVIYGYQVSSTMACFICLVIIPKLSTPCGVCMIGNNTKDSIAKRGGITKFWRYNPHYGLNKLAHDILMQLSRNMIMEASHNENKDVIFNDTGSSKTSIYNDYAE